MINTKKLEKRWYKYKVKNFMQFGMLIFFIIMIPLLAYYLFLIYNGIEKEEHSPKDSRTHIEEKKTTVIEEKSIEAEPNIEKVEEKSEEMLLVPTIPIVKVDDEGRSSRFSRIEKIERPKKKLIKAKESSSLTAKELAILNGKDLQHIKKKINFNQSNTNANYMDVMKKKFEQNKNPREAMLLAKAYYQEEAYVKAEKWALTANNLDKNSDESWLLFAKSKAKLGKRREALTILSSYYKKSKSEKAKELIIKIKAGSF